MVVLAIQGATFAETALTGEEEALFNAQWASLFCAPWSYERRFIDSRMNVVKAGVRAAKNALDERKFGGINAANSEIGLSMIRPGQVGLVEGATPESNNVWKWKHDCVQATNGVGCENWIHSPTAAATAFAVTDDSFFIPLYIFDENCCPRIQTVKLNIGRSNILYYDVCASRIRDYVSGMNIIPLPTTFWGPNDDILIALQHKMNGTTEPRLGGFCIAEGQFLNASTYIAATHTVATQFTAST